MIGQIGGQYNMNKYIRGYDDEITLILKNDEAERYVEIERTNTKMGIYYNKNNEIIGINTHSIYDKYSPLKLKKLFEEILFPDEGREPNIPYVSEWNSMYKRGMEYSGDLEEHDVIEISREMSDSEKELIFNKYLSGKWQLPKEDNKTAKQNPVKFISLENVMNKNMNKKEVLKAIMENHWQQKEYELYLHKIEAVETIQEAVSDIQSYDFIYDTLIVKCSEHMYVLEPHITSDIIKHIPYDKYSINSKALSYNGCNYKFFVVNEIPTLKTLVDDVDRNAITLEETNKLKEAMIELEEAYHYFNPSGEVCDEEYHDNVLKLEKSIETLKGLCIIDNSNKVKEKNKDEKNN